MPSPWWDWGAQPGGTGVPSPWWNRDAQPLVELGCPAWWNRGAQPLVGLGFTAPAVNPATMAAIMQYCWGLREGTATPSGRLLGNKLGERAQEFRGEATRQFHLGFGQRLTKDGFFLCCRLSVAPWHAQAASWRLVGLWSLQLLGAGWQGATLYHIAATGRALPPCWQGTKSKQHTFERSAEKLTEVSAVGLAPDFCSAHPASRRCQPPNPVSQTRR
jgi:hypothetical protein